MRNLVECGSRYGKVRHFIDGDKYTRVSRSKALCGKIGKGLVVYDAIFFNYKLMYPKACKECLKLSKEK